MKNLAIVIPAYKSTFLTEALDSIANQTCKEFTVYIGDDHSPNDLKSIVDQYQGKFDLVYRRFEENMGGKDLVGQWERCIDMTQDEPWLWLFSDDDVMEPKCVEEFYKLVHEKPEAKLVHFNIKVIDRDSKLVGNQRPFPEYLSTKGYLDAKVSIAPFLFSFVVEFIVHRDVFFGAGRFEKFDLAWGSDFISWIKFSEAAGGIYTCPKGNVRWRRSGENVSTNETPKVVYRKLKANIDYMQWVLHFSQQKEYGHPFLYSKSALGEVVRCRRKLGLTHTCTLIIRYLKSIKEYKWAMIKEIITKK